jgi:hypothetical protein
MCNLLHHLTKWPTSEYNQVCLIWECESYFINRASFWWRNTYSILNTNICYIRCCIRWRWVVSFRFSRSTSEGKAPGLFLNKRLGRPQSLSRHFWGKISYSCLESNHGSWVKRKTVLIKINVIYSTVITSFASLAFFQKINAIYFFIFYFIFCIILYLLNIIIYYIIIILFIFYIFICNIYLSHSHSNVDL